MNEVSEIFFSGKHREVVDRTLDAVEPKLLPKDTPYILGSLVYLGRMEEAERFFLLKKEQLSINERVACHYFLGLGMCRHSHYKKSRDYFIKNFSLRKQIEDSASLFYLYQGLGFYNYFAGRMNKAKSNAEKSLAYAMAANFSYGRVTAMDLKGHTLVQTGKVAEGLQALETAKSLAEKIGTEWLKEAIHVSLVSYLAKFDLYPNKTLKSINEKLKSLTKQDVYSQSALLLDLASEHIRRGRITEAKDTLNECCRIVYGFHTRRHAALLNLRYAYVHYLEGDAHLSLNLVRNALSQIDPTVDKLLELRLRGFELKLVKILGIKVCEVTLTKRVTQETKRLGEVIANRILLRETSTLSFTHVGEDPFGDVLDLIKRSPKLAVEKILETGYYGLLTEALELPKGNRILCLDLAPSSLTLFDRGNVLHFPEVLSPSLRKILFELANGPKTKAALIQTVWGYEYHPIRHDSLIYSSIAKLRKLLDNRSHWIEASEEGYHFRSDVSVLFLAAKKEEPLETMFPQHKEALAPTLNLRQQKIMQYLTTEEYIDTATCSKIFDVSEITASRDLAELSRLKFILRIGKGRATKYRLVLSPSLIQTQTPNEGVSYEVN